MRWLARLSVALLVVALVLADLRAARPGRAAPPAKGKRIAVLVAVNKYNRPGIGKQLLFAEQDMIRLKEVLDDAGYRVTLLLGSAEGAAEATHDNIKAALLDKTQDVFRTVTQDDTVVVAFSGHGQQIPVRQGDREVELPFFCPKDGIPGDPDTLTSINDVLDAVNQRGGGRNLILVDACRKFTARAEGKRSKGASMDRSKAQSLHEGIGVMFSCSDRQTADEYDSLGHGLFFYSLLQTIETQKRAGAVTWERLVPEVRTTVSALAEKLDATTPLERRQRPQYIGNFSNDPVLIDATPAEAAEYDLTGGYRFAHFGKDGSVRALVTVNDNKAERFEVHVVDPGTGQRVAGPLKHEYNVSWAAFSPDGRRVVTASADKTAVVWDAATGQKVAGPLKHEDSVPHAAFSPDGRRVVTASSDGTAVVWDAATGEKVAGPLKHEDWVYHAAFSPDGRRIVTASRGKTAVVWDAATGRRIAGPMKHQEYVGQATFNLDGRRVVTASGSGTAVVWDAATGKKVAGPMRHKSRVCHAAFSPDGRRVVTASSDGTAVVWDAATGERVAGPLKHEESVLHAAFSPDGGRIVTASWDKTAVVWDAATGEKLAGPLKHESFIDRAMFSPDGKRVVTFTWTGGGLAILWDTATGDKLGSAVVK